MSILEGPLVFVDIETTGMSYSRGRVIEVAAIRVEDKKIVSSFSSLIDPGMNLSPFITSLTGISDADLAGAPSFYDISDELVNIMSGATFVAHNVRFDYGFLKQELKRIGITFSPKLLCTVKLSKALYPDVTGHKLQNLIDRCGIKVESRHRAFDDASAVWLFIQHSIDKFPAPMIEDAVKLQLKSPSLPKNLGAGTINNLPEQPGVYIFEDNKGYPLYVGKSINIRKRVLSHFSSDHEHASEFKISQQICNINYWTTGGELEALLLESKIIKDLQPLYNRQLRRRRNLTLARRIIDLDGYITISIEEVAEVDPDVITDVLGIYSTKGKARKFIGGIVKDFRLCPRLMGLEKGSGTCFSYQLKRCKGACCGQELPVAYNSRLLNAFDGRRIQNWPFETPVMIAEKSDDDELRSLIIDKWCVIAQINQQPDCEPEVNIQTKMFDLDTYKILRSYLSTKTHKLNIKPVSLDWVNDIALSGIV